MNIFVGNISRDSSDKTLRKEFEKYGEVGLINLISDKYTNTPKGFGFVDMPKKEEAENAIKNLHGTMVDGRALTVNEAKPKSDSYSGGFNSRR